MNPPPSWQQNNMREHKMNDLFSNPHQTHPAFRQVRWPHTAFSPTRITLTESHGSVIWRVLDAQPRVSQ